MAPHTPHFEAFDIERDLGIDKRAFIARLVPTFSALHLDRYDAKRDKVAYLKRMFPHATGRLDAFLPGYYADKEDLNSFIDLIALLTPMQQREFNAIGISGRRKRAIAKFILSYRNSTTPESAVSGELPWHIERVSAANYQQNVKAGDVRGLVRTWREMSAVVTDDPDIRRIMMYAADRIRTFRPDASVLRVNSHQVSVLADRMGQGSNAPEGKHQDGADFIVSAVVIERVGITGGETVVYDADATAELFNRALQPGEGMFQDDRTLWHHALPVVAIPDDSQAPGYRSVIGFDVEIIG
jgi:hypothetical protein